MIKIYPLINETKASKQTNFSKINYVQYPHQQYLKLFKLIFKTKNLVIKKRQCKNIIYKFSKKNKIKT